MCTLLKPTWAACSVLRRLLTLEYIGSWKITRSLNLRTFSRPKKHSSGYFAPPRSSVDRLPKKSPKTNPWKQQATSPIVHIYATLIASAYLWPQQFTQYHSPSPLAHDFQLRDQFNLSFRFVSVSPEFIGSDTQWPITYLDIAPKITPVPLNIKMRPEFDTRWIRAYIPITENVDQTTPWSSNHGGQYLSFSSAPRGR